MPIEYSLDDKLNKAITDVLVDTTFTELDDLRTQEAGFVVAAVRKTTKDGDPKPTSGPPVVIRRVSAADAVFLPDCIFKIYVDMARWDETNDYQHAAMIHAALILIKVEIKEDKVKFASRRPDVITCHENIIRFGPWEEPLLLLRDNLAAAKMRAADLAKSVNRK